MPWQEIEAQLVHLFMRKARADVAMPNPDLFGESLAQENVRKASAISQAAGYNIK